MIEVNVTIDVKASPEEVFPFWADWTNNPTWQTGMESCTWTSEPPLRLGSTYDITKDYQRLKEHFDGPALAGGGSEADSH